MTSGRIGEDLHPTGRGSRTLLGSLAREFTSFAARRCRGSSPLYERLAMGVAGDPSLLGLAARARKNQIVPLLFFGAAHYLLLRGPAHPLAAFYPSVLEGGSGNPSRWKGGGNPFRRRGTARADDPFPHFRDFCQEHAAEIADLLATRRVQTNEVRRSAYLVPAFGLVARQASRSPLSLIEIGSSAGLNLLWDRYGYRYGNRGPYGEPESPVQVHCAVRGDRPPPIPSPFPEVSSRVGIDLHPIDVRDPEATLWLRATVWPEHAARADLLNRAIALARTDPPRLLAGDALALLPDLLATAPRNTTVCLFHTNAMRQFPPEARERLSALIAKHAADRDLFRVSVECLDGDHPLLELTAYRRGTKTQRLLARCQVHGEWIEWVGTLGR